jgi:predicted transcriptional regulator
MEQICRKAARVRVKNFMVTPTEGEMIEPEASLGEAVHQLVLGKYQSLLVVRDKQAVGVLRLTDVAEAVIGEILACSL